MTFENYKKCRCNRFYKNNNNHSALMNVKSELSKNKHLSSKGQAQKNIKTYFVFQM